MNGVGEELLACARLSDQKNGTFAEGHAAQGFFGFTNGRRLPDDIGKTVFGAVTFVKELAPQLILPGLHIVEPLE